MITEKTLKEKCINRKYFYDNYNTSIVKHNDIRFLKLEKHHFSKHHFSKHYFSILRGDGFGDMSTPKLLLESLMGKAGLSLNPHSVPHLFMLGSNPKLKLGPSTPRGDAIRI